MFFGRDSMVVGNLLGATQCCCVSLGGLSVSQRPCVSLRVTASLRVRGPSVPSHCCVLM